MTIAAQCNHDWRYGLQDSDNRSIRKCLKCRYSEPQGDKPEMLLANELVEIGVQLNIISGNDAYTGPQLLQIGRDIKKALARERESRKQAEAALREAAVRCEHIAFTFETPEEFRKNRTGAAYSSGYEAGWRDWCGSNPYAYSQQRYFDAYEAGWRTAQKAVKKKALRKPIPQEPAERESGR